MTKKIAGMRRAWKNGFDEGADECDRDQLLENRNMAEAVDFNDGLNSADRYGIEEGHHAEEQPDNDKAGLPLPGAVPATAHQLLDENPGYKSQFR